MGSEIYGVQQLCNQFLGHFVTPPPRCHHLSLIGIPPSVYYITIINIPYCTYTYMKYCVFIRKYCNRTITANYGGYLVIWRARKNNLDLCCDLEKCLENDFHCACLRTEIFLRERILSSMLNANPKSSHSVDPQFSHKLLFYLH